MNLSKLLSELKETNKIVISDSQNSLTGKQFAEKVDNLSKKLLAMDIKDKKCCLLRLTNSIDSICILFAALTNRAMVFIANPHDPIEKLCKSMHQFSIYALLADKATTITVQKRLSEFTFVKNQAIEGVDFYSVLVKENSYPISFYDIRMSEADIAIFSSGSTGEPKAILHRMESLLLNAAMHVEAIDLRSSDVIGITLPLYYSYGLVANLLSGLVVKADINLNKQIGAIDIDWLMAHKISVLSVTPYLAKRLNKHPSKLRIITVGGDILYSKQALQLLADFPDSSIYSTYGLTEAGPRVATHLINLDDIEKNNMLPLGMPLKNVSLTLMNNSLNDSDFGELVVNTPTHMLGYFYGQDKGFFPKEGKNRNIETGDLYEKISGNLFFRGRKKKIIVQGGEKLFPSMIESIINDIEGVIDVMVDSVPHLENGDVAKAYIVTNKDITINSIRKELLKNISRSMIPEQLEFVESIPRSVTGKILSKSLT